MSCSVCFESFNQSDRKPKILSCGHTFCSKCLISLVQSHKGLVPCPMCQTQQEITDVSKLITNFGILDLDSVSQEKCAKEKGPAVSAGYCDEHGEHKLFLCKTCDVWICHVCTVTEHPTGKCNVISIKKALVEKKEDIKVQLQQSIEASKKMLDSLESDGSELHHWHGAQNHFISEQEQIQAKCKELATKVDEAKDQGLIAIKTFRELQDDLVGAEKLQDVDVCAQKIGQMKERALEWMEAAGDNASWKSSVSHMRNLQVINSFTQELQQAVETLSGDQLEAIIRNARAFALPSSDSMYVEVEVNFQPQFAKVSNRSMTSAVLGDLDSKRPSPEASIMRLADLMAKFSLMYVEVKTPEKQLYLPLEKDSEECFWMKDPQEVSPQSHRRHLIIPMTMMLESDRLWFKHWFAERFSRFQIRVPSSKCLWLSPFAPQHPPEGSFIMTADVVAMLRPIVRVRLWLEWDGKRQGGLSILLFEGFDRNVQFQLLCCGDNGLSYQKSRFLSVANRGRPGEKVTLGHSDGAGGRSLLPDLPPEEVKGRPVTAGLMARKPNSSHLVIYTKGLPGTTEPFALGEVFHNLHILEEAVKVENICDVTLPDCCCYWEFPL